MACDLYSLYYVQSHALRPLQYSFGARHDNYLINFRYSSQETRHIKTLVQVIIGCFLTMHKHAALTHYIVDTSARRIVMPIVAQNSAGVW